MRVLLCFLISCFLFILPSDAAINGIVQKEDEQGFAGNTVIDAQTGRPISKVLIKVPAKNIETKTDASGRFDLKTRIDSPTIMSLQKDGYKPYSLTLSDSALAKPLVVGIEKSNPKDVIVETDSIHLGDDRYADTSANAFQFTLKAVGPFYTKNFNIKPIQNNENAYIIVGSIIGIDTEMAKQLGQSRVVTAYASPPTIFFNGNEIAEIKINGDGQVIKLPKQIVRPGSNTLTIKAGKNMAQQTYIDYDDIEFTNLIVEVR